MLPRLFVPVPIRDLVVLLAVVAAVSGGLGFGAGWVARGVAVHADED